MDEKLKVLRMCYLFHDIPDADLVPIAEQAEEKLLPKQTLFIEEGTMPNHIYVILSGLVKIFRITEEGKEIILALRSRGDVVGEFELLDKNATARSVSIQALEPTRVLALSKATVARLEQTHPGIVLAMARYIVALLRKKNTRIEQLVTQSLADRTYALLVTLQKYFPNNEIILSHEDISSLVFATRPRVTEALNSLAQEGKIILSHKSIRLT